MRGLIVLFYNQYGEKLVGEQKVECAENLRLELHEYMQRVLTKRFQGLDESYTIRFWNVIFMVQFWCTQMVE